MTKNEISAAVEKHASTSAITANLYFKNQKVDSQKHLDAGEPWARLTVLYGAGTTAGIRDGSACYETLGRAFLNVFTPKGEGEGEATTIIDNFEAAFSYLRLGSIEFFAPQSEGSTNSDGFEQNSASVQFRFYTEKEVIRI